MNYQIIQNESELDRFLSILPDTKSNEKYYLALFCRKKYDTENLGIKCDKQQLKRFLASKGDIKSKIRQLECKIGCYTYDGIPIPNNMLSLYIMPTPRDLDLATRKSLIKFANIIAERRPDNQEFHNPYKEVINQIQTSKSETLFMDFDFDICERPNINGIVNNDAVHMVKTRGGWHILVEVGKVSTEFKKTFYQNLKKLGADVSGDCLLPCPGTIQGGFIPYMENDFISRPN